MGSTKFGIDVVLWGLALKQRKSKVSIIFIRCLGPFALLFLTLKSYDKLWLRCLLKFQIYVCLSYVCMYCMYRIGKFLYLTLYFSLILLVIINFRCKISKIPLIEIIAIVIFLGLYLLALDPMAGQPLGGEPMEPMVGLSSVPCVVTLMVDINRWYDLLSLDHQN